MYYPKISPNSERAVLLASFGAQGALVAHSPYYGCLIGEILGYERENIHHHVKQTCNVREIPKAVLDQVYADLQECSLVKPLDRWRDGYKFQFDSRITNPPQRNDKKRRKKKKFVSSKSIEDLESFLGKSKKKK